MENSNTFSRRPVLALAHTGASLCGFLLPGPVAGGDLPSRPPGCDRATQAPRQCAGRNQRDMLRAGAAGVQDGHGLCARCACVRAPKCNTGESEQIMGLAHPKNIRHNFGCTILTKSGQTPTPVKGSSKHTELGYCMPDPMSWRTAQASDAFTPS
eukprot:scaffold40465_cov14-Tisochrysis_lutea.AAC.1